MSRRGQISIDRIVTIRSSALPFYVVIDCDGRVVAQDEVTHDEFLTTKMYGDKISIQSIRGYYLSAEGGEIRTKRYCSSDERFTVEKVHAGYAFRSRSGHYLSMSDREPFLRLTNVPEEFQLFSLMMYGINVGKQLEDLERTSSVMIENLLDEQHLTELQGDIAAVQNETEPGGKSSHELRICGLGARKVSFARLSTHPLVLQLVKRLISCTVRLSDVESCRTDADFVRKELEETTWDVVHPYNAVEYPGIVDPRISFTATWFLDEFNASNSTWAFLKAPLTDGTYSPQLPQHCSAEEVDAIQSSARPLHAKRGAVWLTLGPMWLSNNTGAGCFWKDYDAQTRYKHLSGQKESGGSFRAIADAQRNATQKDELCPTLIQATYIREYVQPRVQMQSESLAVLAETHGVQYEVNELECMR
jgi:hypothetical protein